MDGIESSASLDVLLPSLLKAKRGFAAARKDASNPHFRSKYATLKSILEACSDSLYDNGLMVSFPLRPAEGGTEISCVLLHESQQWMRSRVVVPTPTVKPQDVGSVVTYYQRYLLSALLAIATEDDDDGEAARASAAPRDVQRPSPRETYRRDTEAARAMPEDDPAKSQWASYVAKAVSALNLDWRNEMAMENVPQEKRKGYSELVNQHQMMNHVATRACEAGLIDPDSILSPGKGGEMVRDYHKAAMAVSKLYRERPKSVVSTCESHMMEKLQAARIAVGILPEVLVNDKGND